jgi:SHS2 domain-containing protein
MHRFVDHTSELELELEAGSAEGVLQEALVAFAELAGDGEGDVVERELELEADDLPALLARWLDELLYLAESEGLLAESAELALRGSRLAARVRLRHGEPRPLVKAVTLHRLRFRPENGVWRGRVVLDV